MMTDTYPVEFVPTLLTPEEVEGEFNLALRRMEVLHLRSIIDKHFDGQFPNNQWNAASGEGFMTNILLLRDDTVSKMRGG